MGIPVDSSLDFRQEGTPGAPAAGITSLYVKSDSGLYLKDVGGVERKVAIDPLADADVSATAAIAESKLALASDAAVATASRRTIGPYGTGSGVQAQASDIHHAEAATAYSTASTAITANTWTAIPCPGTVIDIGGRLASGWYYPSGVGTFWYEVMVQYGAGAGTSLVALAYFNNTLGTWAFPSGFTGLILPSGNVYNPAAIAATSARKSGLIHVTNMTTQSPLGVAFYNTSGQALNTTTSSFSASLEITRLR